MPFIYFPIVRLGRGIFVVGLPYPSPSDPVLKERLSFRTLRTGSHQDFYVDLCMNSINQSIGRAIRHIGDYASIVLIDHRYSEPRHFEVTT